MNIKVINTSFDNVTTFHLSCMKRSESEYFVNSNEVSRHIGQKIQ